MTGDVPGDLRTMQKIANSASMLHWDVLSDLRERKLEGRNARRATTELDVCMARNDAMRWLEGNMWDIADIAVRLWTARMHYPHLELSGMQEQIDFACKYIASTVSECRWLDYDVLIDYIGRCDDAAKRELKRMEDAYEETQNRSRGIKYAAIS